MIGLYKAELVRRHGPWRNLEHLELSTLEWVDWYNRRRLHSWCGHIPPAEFEANWAQATVTPDDSDAEANDDKQEAASPPLFPFPVNPRRGRGCAA